MPVDVLLVDDHRVVRDGIRSLIERSADFQVVAEAETGAEAIEICRKSLPRVVIMDIGLENGMNGIDATTEILRHWPEARVLILSGYDDENTIVSASARVHGRLC